ncbi:competence protein CoiA [Bacillus pinisoli]|uniref:competence protein CoiA n=1 Tax=Bacillus pinisoli TaxID=2901866 RepID=UPI001FF490FE|nr:competence protein CoiA family protein [Bacillus pinisoli]
MLVAIDQYGNKISPITKNTEEIKFLSQCKVLYCSECEKPVTFFSGQKQVPHFRHDKILNCVYESEPETKEHLEGKIQIYNWLKELFPDAQVEMEYKIQETNQRADVMAILPNGKRIAVEMQCSRISGNEWLDRHNLYKSVGIQDVWVLGSSVHTYGITNGEVDEEKHRLVSLSEAIFKQFKSLFFLDTESVEVKAIYPFIFESRMSSLLIKGSEERFELKEGIIRGHLIGTDHYFQMLLEWKKKREEERIEQMKREQEEKEEEKQYQLRLKKQQLERERMLERQQLVIQQINTNRKSYIRHIDIHLDYLRIQMTPNEQALFNRLCEKHNFNAENFPGFLNVYTLNDFLIETPRQVWQLYLYDKYLYQKEKVWLDNVKNDFWKLKKSGVFRIKYMKETEATYSFAIYDYIFKLGQTGYLTQLGWRPKYQQINCKALPRLHDGVANRYVSLYISSMERKDYGRTDRHLHEEYIALNRKELTTNEIIETYNVYSAMLDIEKPVEVTKSKERVIDPIQFMANRSFMQTNRTSAKKSRPTPVEINKPVVATIEDLLKIHEDQLNFIQSKEDKISQGLQKDWIKISSILQAQTLEADFSYSSFKVNLTNLYNSVDNK